MKILILSNGADNGGVGIGIKRAFDRYAPDWSVRSVTRAQNFIGFEPDVFWAPGDPGTHVADLYRQADVVHVMDKFEAAIDVPGYSDRKPMVMHHHGSIFRARPDGFIAECRHRGIQALVATFDLLRYAPDELEWLPNPIDLELMEKFRATEYRKGPVPKVIHTPGAGDNGTNALLRAAFEQDHYEVEVVSRKPWFECMKHKARADVLFDSFNIGYGLTSIEAFAMGIPVVSGADPDTEERVLAYLGYRPYLATTENDVGDHLAQMTQNWALQNHYATVGWQCANDFHAQVEVVRRLKVIYERAAS